MLDGRSKQAASKQIGTSKVAIDTYLARTKRLGDGSDACHKNYQTCGLGWLQAMFWMA